ncbi:MAG: TrbG/VirB9 family P-type conjugative transfer protein [Bdellovibrionaceae bacterium]|nr:TrbG/VirB9 family P-type conjugative transfer protein [Pseudobdellovibrionaceae bacterium]NUM59112.1 TrbG/VirB9 family P-type conjugative transfer protein [Pseudobdellovibrionaceae bacterium]
MKNKLITILAFSLMAWKADAAQRVRRVPVQGDQIVTVKTSIGIATIIQVPDRPNSVVVGDQDSFKVEYLDQAITIKPLTGGAKSNLYIYTDWKRFNVELVSGSEANADYVVYLEMPKDKPLATQTKDFGVLWTEFKNQLRNDNLNLNIKRVGRAKNGILLIEFNVSSTKKETFKPEWIWLTQMGETQPIHNLFMSSLEVSPQRTISGVLQLREVDLNINETFKIEVRRNKVSYLTVQKVATWKR